MLRECELFNFKFLKLCFSLIFVGSFFAKMVFASDENKSIEKSPVENHCHHSFYPEIKVDIVSSGRDADQLPMYKELLTKFYEPGGVADRLGIAKPPHQAVFAPSAQLAMLATLGRHAVKHWHDGAQLIHAYRSAGVLEFVTPGCATCRSFYSDTTDPIHQLSVIMHVFGHNHFAAHAIANKLRNTDPIAESVYLGREIIAAKRVADRGEVDFWYQVLSSFTYLQDIFTGSFENPEVLKSRPNYDENGVKKPILPFSTPSILQSLVHNLPPTAPEWKKAMTSHFEKMNRVYGYYTSNKILNEGFAVMCQRILPQYTGYNSHEHTVEYGELLRGVVGRGINLSNPYWLGEAAWLNFYDDLKEMPEYASLKQEDFDQMFIKKATEIIRNYSDFDGLKLLLNKRFVEKYKLYLKRELHYTEYDWSIPKDDPRYNEQFAIGSRDPEKIVAYIADQFANRRNRMPEMHVSSLDAQAGNAILLRYQPFKDKALHFKNAVLTSYIIAIAYERRVILEGEFFIRGEKTSLRVEITGDTEVEPARVWDLDAIDAKNNTDNLLVGKEDAEYKRIARKYIREFRDSNYGFNGAQVEEQLDRFIPFAESIVEDNVQSISRLLTHAPETAGAIQEYIDKVKTSLPGRLNALMSGQLKGRNMGKGVALKVLPDIPMFTYDKRWEQQKEREYYDLQNQGNPTQRIQLPTIDTRNSSVLANMETTNILAGDLGAGDGRVGDKKWGKGSKDEDEDGDGDDGDDDIEDARNPRRRRSSGKEAGKGSSLNPNEVFISFDRLVEMMDLELPNRKKRKKTEILMNDTILEGGIRKPNGEELWLRMMPEIMVVGNASLLRKAKENGEDPKQKTFSLMDQFKEGLLFMKEEDIIVRDREPVKVPDTRAVFIRVMDVSGSMMGEPQEIALRFYKTMEVLLRKKYKTLKIINVGFDTQAHIMSDEDFFRITLGGGTEYTAGLKKAHEISTMAEFQDYDKYMVLAGDFGMGMEPEFMPTIDKLWEELNWGGMVYTDPTGIGWANQTYLELLQNLEKENEWFSYGKIASELSSHLEVLKHFFGKKKSSQK